MAKILVSFFSGIEVDGEYQIPPFYEGFIQSLKKEGNDVLIFISSKFLCTPWNGSNKTIPGIDKNVIEKTIKEFDPEIVLAFNNSKYEHLEEIVDCPIVLVNGDAIDFFNDKELILKDIHKYYFLFFAKDGVSRLRELGVSEKKIIRINPATTVEQEDLEKIYPISFIGTCFQLPFQLNRELLNYKGSRTKLREVIMVLSDNFYGDADQVFEKYSAMDIKKAFQLKDLLSMGSVQQRISVLNSVVELGLTIFGGRNWDHTMSLLPWLAMSYDSRSIYSVKQNQEVYNKSTLCLNVSHSQAKTSFSWRVFDILASNGCLVSDKKQDLIDLTKGYVKLPIYESSSECYFLCKKLLDDPKWREDVKLGSQAFIEEKGRWPSRLKEIEEFFGISLTDLRREGRVVFVERKIKFCLGRDSFYVRGYKKGILPLKRAVYATLLRLFPDAFLKKVHKALSLYFNYNPDWEVVESLRGRKLQINMGGFVSFLKKCFKFKRKKSICFSSQSEQN